MGVSGAGQLACGGGDELPPGRGSAGWAGSGGSSSVPCPDGESKACSITIGLHGSVLDCYEGTQHCEAGLWGACSDGKTVERAYSGGGSKPQAIGPSTPCQNNPCDPYCRNYAHEIPEAGLTPEGGGTPKFIWDQGSIEDLPGGLTKKGLTEPCLSGSDCQFNYHCTNVKTSSSCAHSKCVTGSALPSTCDPCVALVCAADPGCCSATSCAHDVCQTGTKLTSGCNTCVTSVCAARPSCCSTSWDAQCVSLVAATCSGVSCGCPSGTIENSGRCYKAQTGSDDWTDSRSSCQAVASGWDLVSISDAAENAFVRSSVSAGSWIGLNDSSTEGAFAWANGDAVTYTNWNRQPDNGSDSDCVALIQSSGYWDDLTCTTANRSLCEGPLTPGAPVCPTGTVEFSGICYSFSTSTETFANAETECQAIATDYHLVTIDSAAENTFVRTNITVDNTYIGFNDVTTEGSWVWQAGGGSGYTNWLRNPDNSPGTADCTRLTKSTGTWSDENCTDTDDSACEGPLASATPTCATGEVLNVTTGTCYFVQATADDWVDAEAACAARGAGFHLATISNAAESTFVRGLTASGDYWIGLNDRGSEGTAWWTDTSLAWSGWHSVSSNAGGRDCVAYTDSTDAWTFIDCSPSGGRPYVCEGPTRRCFNGNVEANGACYFVDTTNRTWSAAQTSCRARGTGWDLATIDNATENAAVQGLTTATDNWIGYGDTATEGSFVWSNGSTSTYTNWEQLAPTGGTTQNCAVMVIETGTPNDGRWNDLSCGTGRRYVCEGPKTAPQPCATGQSQLGASCYALDTTTRDWVSAQTSCRARGTGWDLATVDSGTENTFVQALTSSTNTWIGLNDRTTENSFGWSNGASLGYSNWAPIDPNGGSTQDCASMLVSSGTPSDARWQDESCSNSRPAFCEGPKVASGLSPNSWSQSCVDRVQTACDATCGNGSGQCVPWLPGQTDPNCSGIDLAVGVPCGDEVIPVCNHGTAEAPAGISIVHFSANSQQYPLCAPNLTSATRKDNGECVTTQPIPPGECVDVPCPSLNQNNEIMVNPPGQAGYVAECSCLDNWSLYNKGNSCGEPVCSAAASGATLTKVNLYFVFDRSGSMNDALPGGGTKWTGSVNAMRSFVQSASSSGIGVALEFFPLTALQTVSGLSTGDGCHSLADCSSAPCGNPMVSLGTLTALAAPTDSQEDKLVKALTIDASGNTPSYPAMRGALDWAITNEQADPASEYIVVLVTDGDPTRCLSGPTAATTNAQIAADAADAYANYGIRTYAISQEGANIAALDTIAQSGGTGSAFVVRAGNQAQVTADLAAALQAIAGEAAGCSFDLPNPGGFNPNDALVKYTSGSGVVTNLQRQPDAATCGSGWYYDDNANPTKVTLCPSTCGTVQSDTGAQLDVALGCPVVLVPSTYTQIYEATCPSALDQGPQWGYFAYSALTPGDSTVLFRVRTARTQAELASASFTTMATLPPDPDDCSTGGPAPCPKSLYNALGVTSAKYPFLELEITLNPSTDKQFAPTVNSWNVAYACPFNQ